VKILFVNVLGGSFAAGAASQQQPLRIPTTTIAAAATAAAALMSEVEHNMLSYGADGPGDKECGWLPHDTLRRFRFQRGAG
jgi:hypothetical protein